MRTVVNLITAAAFLLHFALGCCAHHVHAAEEVNVHDCATHDHSGHHHDQPASDDESTDESHCPAEHCDDGHCVFALCGKTVLVKAMFIAVLPAFDAVTGIEPALYSKALTAAIDSEGLIALPVRTHLLHQVFLI